MHAATNPVQRGVQNLQAPSLALAPRTFEPLGPGEAPGPGTLLALDAEFVAHSPPDTELRGCAHDPPCVGLRAFRRCHATNRASCQRCTVCIVKRTAYPKTMLCWCAQGSSEVACAYTADHTVRLARNTCWKGYVCVRRGISMEVFPTQLKLACVSLMPRATCYKSDPRLGL